MKQKKGFTLRQVCGENVIVGEGLEAINFGKLISLNESAAFLWKQATELGEFTPQQLADALQQEYEVSDEQAQTDVNRIVKEWQKVGIVEE
ncbi:MAG: PqqD family protein [Prevotella sp.]|nr:PqqD family protein [Prevotella sp.]